MAVLSYRKVILIKRSSMMKEPVVTVFVTVYNIEEYLDRFFECLLTQTMPDFEALIIDDGSADNTLSICTKYAEKDERIRIMSLDHIGISAARNIALQNIHTEFAASMDGDDFYDKDYLKHMLDAQQKYNADYVISNVIYLNEDHSERWRFDYREGGFYTKESFPDLLPELFSEERLTYLFGKLFRTELLRGISVEEDVKTGSDIIINCQYVLKADNLAVIEDYDSYNVKYNSRSVTSYRGDDYFFRHNRITRYVNDCMESNGMLSDSMCRVLDKRTFLMGRNALNNFCRQKISIDQMCEKAAVVIGSEEYKNAYERERRLGNLDSFGSEIIVAPGKEADYIDLRLTVRTEEKENRRKEKLLALCPDFLFRIYHKAKIRLGLIPPDTDKQQ